MQTLVRTMIGEGLKNYLILRCNCNNRHYFFFAEGSLELIA